jgi:RluA family pseudouridine synthase
MSENNFNLRENQIIISKEDTLFNSLLENFSFIKNIDDCIKLINQKRILINGEICQDENIFVKKEYIISILTPREFEPKINENFDIIYEDEYLFAINKPPHLPIHPAGKYFFNTLTNLIKEKTNIKEFYPVNRLDRETSGIVLFAKDKVTAKELGELFFNCEVQKEYLAICYGRINTPTFLIDKSLSKGEFQGIRNHVFVDENGKESQTEVEVILSNENFSLVIAKPKTGRSHQIRVHLASIGHPIVGDKEYGIDPQIFARYTITGDLTEAKEKLLTDNHFLHCQKVIFFHPKKGFELELTAQTPENMQIFINKNF